jgi:hypothetical protein
MTGPTRTLKIGGGATLAVSLLIIAGAEALLFTDVALSHRGAIHTAAAADAVLRNEPTTWLGDLARIVAVNITPIAWAGYLLALDGILAMQRTGSPVRRRPHHFALLCFASVFIWCVFDFINFHNGMYAWVYIGMPADISEKFVPYLLAFGSIVPGMLMSGQVMLNFGWFEWARTRPPEHPRDRRLLSAVSILIGLAMVVWPIVYPNPVTNLTLWTSFVFLLDPINDALGRPSMFRDWRHGWYGRTLAAFAGGLLCGFLWEFWNYWALGKWTYHLPFLGAWGRYHYFEMPLPGLLGFLPFGLECWVMWQTIRAPLDGLVEPLPDEALI